MFLCCCLCQSALQPLGMCYPKSDRHPWPVQYIVQVISHSFKVSMLQHIMLQRDKLSNVLEHRHCSILACEVSSPSRLTVLRGSVHTVLLCT